MTYEDKLDKLTYQDFTRARDGLEKANVSGEKLVLTPEGLFSLEETEVGTLWHKV